MNESKWSCMFLRKVRRVAARIRARIARREVAPDGIVILTCDRPAGGITPRGFAILVAIFMIIKGAAIAHLGAASHAEAIRGLRNGGVLDQVAAFIMVPDPASLFISARLEPVLR